MDATAIFIIAGALIVGGVLFAIITIKGGRSTLDMDRYRSKWLAIEQQCKKSEPASYQLAVLNADKLLDHALKELGIAGQTMGDRMKTVAWSNANAVWASHKLRNQIAHEPDVRVSYDTARRALAGFKLGLKDIGAI